MIAPSRSNPEGDLFLRYTRGFMEQRLEQQRQGHG